MKRLLIAALLSFVASAADAVCPHPGTGQCVPLDAAPWKGLAPIVSGSTPVTGTSGNILWDNAGTLGDTSALPSGITTTATSGTTAAKLTDVAARTYYVDDFGAVGAAAGTPPSVDDTTAINAALSAAGTAGGGRVFLNPAKGYLLNSAVLTVPHGVELACPAPAPKYDPNSNNHTAHSCAVYINPAYTPVVAGTLENIYVINKNLTYPTTLRAAINAVAAFSGTGVSMTDHDARLRNVMILGFNQCVSVNGYYHPQIEHLMGDCTNGLYANNVQDLARVEHVEFFPFTTYPSAQYSDAPYYQLAVSGAADNGSGAYRITVSTTAKLATGDTVFISGIGGAVGANGRYTVTVVDNIHIDLQSESDAPTPTIATTSGSTFVTVSSVANLAIGQSISGTNIPGGATITAVWPQSLAITISAAATGTGSGISATVTNGAYTSGGQVAISPSYRTGTGFNITNSDGFYIYNGFVFFYENGFVYGTGSITGVCSLCTVDAPEYLVKGSALTGVTFSGTSNYGNRWTGGYIASQRNGIVQTSTTSVNQVPNMVSEMIVNTVEENILEQTGTNNLILHNVSVRSNNTGQALFNDSVSTAWLDLDSDYLASVTLYTSSGGYSKVRATVDTQLAGSPLIGSALLSAVTAGIVVTQSSTLADNRWYMTGNATDQKYATCYEDSSGNFSCRFMNDARNASTVFMTATRGTGYTATNVTFGAEVMTPASTASGAGFNIAPGVAPTTPNDGDCWITSTFLFCQVGGTVRQYAGALVGNVYTVAQGGTGNATVTAHGVLFGEGTAHFNASAALTAGQLIIGQGATVDPSAQTMSGDCTITSAGAITCPLSTGTVPTASGTCAVGTVTGGGAAGSMAPTGACSPAATIILTFAKTAANGYWCHMEDLTTSTGAVRQSAMSTNSCTLTVTGALVGSDVMTYEARGF